MKGVYVSHFIDPSSAARMSKKIAEEFVSPSGSQHATCKTIVAYGNNNILPSQGLSHNNQKPTTTTALSKNQNFGALVSSEKTNQTIYLFNQSYLQTKKTFFEYFSNYSILNRSSLSSHFQPSKLLVLTCFLFSFFFLYAHASPMRGTDSSLQQHSKTNLNTLDQTYVDGQRQFLLNSRRSENDVSEAIFRLKRSSNVENTLRKSQNKAKTRKTRKTKPNGENKKRKRKRKAKRKTRRTDVNQMSSNNLMNRITTNQPDMPSSPRRQRLYNKVGTSFHLAVWKNGSVSGEPSEKRSKYSVLEMRGVAEGGTVTIMGVATKKYICVTKRGVVKAKKKYNKVRCRFQEKILQNNQNTYQSLSCKRCFLNLSKKGRIRRLNGAKPQLTQAHFLPRHLERGRKRNGFKFSASKRDEVISIDFSAFNETELSTEKLDSILKGKYEVDGVGFEKSAELNLKKEIQKHPSNSSRSHHSNFSKLFSQHQKHTNTKTVEVRKSKIKTRDYID